MEETKKTYPPSASHGGDNAYYLKGCEVVGHQPAYAACLFKITEVRADRLQSTFGACVDEIKCGRCKATGMLQEEELKGAALYYFPRQFIQSKVITNLTPVSEIPTKAKPYQSPVVTHKVQKPLIPDMGDGYAAAINAAMTEEPSTKQEPSSPMPTKDDWDAAFDIPTISPNIRAEIAKTRPAIQPGETPLQYARRVAELSKQANHQQTENV